MFSFFTYKRVAAVAMGSIVFLTLPFLTQAYNTAQDYPRTVAWQLNANATSAQDLARYDVVILDMNAENTNPNLFGQLRAMHPGIVILAYTSPIEAPKAPRLAEIEPPGTGLWHDLVAGLQPEWYLKTYTGDQFSIWSGNVVLNLARRASNGQTYADYLSHFLTTRVLATGKWDGLLFDTVHDSISGFNANIDINGDGKKDTAAFIDQQWRAGMTSLLQQLRTANGEKYALITNGDGQYSTLNNGRMFESFPEFYEGGWTGSIQRYLTSDQGGRSPRFNILNSDTNNTGNFANYSAMRFGLTSTLLANGYYNFDFGTNDRSHTPYYDEYDVSLGRPTGAAYNVTSPSTTTVTSGVWRRDFEKGVSLVNSGTTTRTYQLPAPYETIHGSQDPYTNNGRTVTSVTLPPQDGIVLLHPLQQIVGTAFVNGGYVRVFSNDGSVARSAFFSYDQRFAGSAMVAKADINHDNHLETVVADASSITIYRDNGSVQAKFYPYTSAYKSGINFALGDLNGDGKLEIVTGTGPGGGPQVRIFAADGHLLSGGFFAYTANFRGGVNVAVGDVDGDGKAEIITGAGSGGGPEVRVFDSKGNQRGASFLAYNASFRGGVNVAAGDTDGDGKAEIITGAGVTGGPHVKLFTAQGTLLTQFFAFSAQSNQGVRVAAMDVDGDRRAEILALTTDYTLFNK